METKDYTGLNYRNDPDCKFGCKNCYMLEVEVKPYTQGMKAKCNFVGEADRLYWFRTGVCDYYKEKSKELQIAERLAGVWDIEEEIQYNVGYTGVQGLTGPTGTGVSGYTGITGNTGISHKPVSVTAEIADRGG